MMATGWLKICFQWRLLGEERTVKTREKVLEEYGYGLPSASLSLAKKYTIYSKVKGGDWHNIVFDITKLEGDK